VTVVAFQRKKAPEIGITAPYPGFIQPALATVVDTVPRGAARWIHEIKFDGYRVQVHLKDADIKPRPRLDKPLPQDRKRRLADQCRFGDHRWRGRGAQRERDH
jgi:hypothetical protein